MDLLVRIRNKYDFEEDDVSEGYPSHYKETDNEPTEHNTIYYYENAEFTFPTVLSRSVSNEELEQNQGIYTTKNHKST